MSNDNTRLWSRWLLATLDGELAAAEADGLPIDPAAIAVAHVLHGAMFAHNVAGFSDAAVAEYLRCLADAIERRDPWLPALVWVEQREIDDVADRA